jgi:hypothetical protein
VRVRRWGLAIGMVFLCLGSELVQGYFCNNLIVRVLDAETKKPIGGAFISGKMFAPEDGWYGSFGNETDEEGYAKAEICGTACFLKVVARGYETELYNSRPPYFLPEKILFQNKDVSVIVELRRKKASEVSGKKE